MVMLPARILTIPVELFIEILKHLDHKEIVRCISVCKTFQETISHSLELQYKIELAFDGLVDLPTPTLATSDKLQLLLDRRRRWRILDWTQEILVPVAGACQAYELVGGVFSKTMSVGWESSGSRHFIATWLPTRSDPGTTLVRPDLGISTKDFAIDPTQDLLALVDADDNHAQLQQAHTVRIKVHLRTISTNVKPPKAARPILTAEIQFFLGSSFIQIVDDVVGLFFWVHGPGLIIWNWVTGEIVVKCVSFELPPGTWDFAFLSNRSFMITATAEHGSVELYTFDGTPNRSDHNNDSGGDPLIFSPTHVGSLRLPPLKPGQEIQNFSTHSGPFVKGQAAGKPFETAPDTRIHLISLHYGDHGPRYHLFVHNRFLLSLVDESRTCAGGLVRKEWEEWGPRNTRMLPHRVQFQWLRYVHGTRVVLPPFLSSFPHNKSTLCVLDFNVHPSRTNDPVSVVPTEWSGGKYESITSPSVAPAGAVFQEDVVTHLPYAESQREGSFLYSGFLIDDERIIGMKSMAFADGNMSDVVVYTF